MENDKSSGKWGWIVGTIVVVLLLVGAARTAGPTGSSSTSEGDAPSTGPIKIGVIAPITGDAAAYGEPARNIYLLTQNEINAGGGINGRPIELVIEDGKCNGTDAASAAQKLVHVDKVVVILGGVCSSETLAAIPVAEAGKVPVFSPAASSPHLTGKSRYFARNNPSDLSQGKVFAELATKENAKALYVLVEQTDYAKGVAGAVKTNFTGSTTIEEFPSTATDLRPLVTKAKNAKSDFFVIVTQTPATAQKILKAMRDLKWRPKLIINDGPAGDPATLSQFKDVLGGAYTAKFSADPRNAKFAKALADYKSAYGVEMPFQSYGQTEYDALFLISDAIKAVGTDGTKIADWLHSSVRDWKGASGSLTIGANGDSLIGHKLEIVKNGKTEPVK